MAPKSLPIALSGMFMAAALLTACGTTPTGPANAAQRSTVDATAQSATKTASKKRLVPPAVKLPAKHAAPKASSGMLTANYSVENVATNALFQYNDLRNQWLGTYDDYQKSAIEQQMLSTLTYALQQIQGMAYGDYNLQSAASNALQQYQYLDNQWNNSYDPQQKEYIVNEMLNQLTGAVKNIQVMSAN